MKYVVTHVEYKYVRDKFVIDDDMKNIDQLADYILSHSTLSYLRPAGYDYDVKIDIQTYEHIVRYGEDEGKLRLAGRIMFFYTTQNGNEHMHVDFDMLSTEPVIPTKYIWK